MDYKEKTRTEESNAAELNLAEENTTAKASAEDVPILPSVED